MVDIALAAAEAVPPPPAPWPPLATAVTLRLLAVPSVMLSVEVAAPAVLPVVVPESPPFAVCVKVNAPEVEPPIALFIVELAPDPPE